MDETENESGEHGFSFRESVPSRYDVVPEIFGWRKRCLGEISRE